MERGVLEDIQSSDNLLVTFGGILQGFGMPIFEFQNSIKNLETDKIFIRDFHQSWYHEGVDDSIDSLNKLSRYLKNIIEQGNYKNITFLGNSMGGYAAIYFGVQLNVSTIISFSPQTFRSNWLRYRHSDKRWQKQIKKTQRSRYYGRETKNLNKYLRNANYKSQVFLHYSQNDILDTKHANFIKERNNVSLKPHVLGDHNLVKNLRDNGDLIKIIKSSFPN